MPTPLASCNKISGFDACGKSLGPVPTRFAGVPVEVTVKDGTGALTFGLGSELSGFVGGCYGIEEDLVHYSVSEITKASNLDAFKRCTLKEIPQDILKGVKKIGTVTMGPFKKDKK